MINIWMANVRYVVELMADIIDFPNKPTFRKLLTEYHKTNQEVNELIDKLIRLIEIQHKNLTKLEIIHSLETETDI